MNFTENYFTELKNKIESECEKIYNDFLVDIEKYADSKDVYYYLESGKLEGIEKCLSFLFISNEDYYKLYSIVRNYEKKIDKIYFGGVEF